jgi:hypothetical protein
VTPKENTGLPVTTPHGSNILTGTNKEKIIESAFLQISGYDGSRSYNSVKPK